LDGRLSTKATVRRRRTKLIHEGRYAAEIELEYDEETWSPTMSLEDARKLERVRLALRRGDYVAAAREAYVFELTPVSA
jgi:hypothetical protein